MDPGRVIWVTGDCDVFLVVLPGDKQSSGNEYEETDSCSWEHAVCLEKRVQVCYMVNWGCSVLLEFICGKNLVSISRDKSKGFWNMMVAEFRGIIWSSTCSGYVQKGKQVKYSLRRFPRLCFVLFCLDQAV